MADDIKGLIEKIQEEGVKVAAEKAQQIESQAKDEAGQIIRKARSEAERIILEAQDKVHRLEEASRASLGQAGRDLLISLKKEVSATLDRILTTAVRQALTSGELAKILYALITAAAQEDKSKIIISVSKGDLERLEKGFLAELKEETKKGITLKVAEDIAGGFLISYDAGGSHFDFTDQALADYLGRYLKPELARLLKE